MPTSRFRTVAMATLGVLCGASGMIGYRTMPQSFNLAGIVAIFGTPGVASAAPGSAVSLPKELFMPSIGVSAAVNSVGVTASDNLLGPSDAVSVGWYKYGARPGAPGVAVIDGHVETKYVAHGVFYNLDKLKAGDEVDVLTANNQLIPFVVTAAKLYPYNASTTDIFTAPGGGTGSELNLITCAGDWLPDKKVYNERLVVFTVKK